MKAIILTSWLINLKVTDIPNSNVKNYYDELKQ